MPSASLRDVVELMTNTRFAEACVMYLEELLNKPQEETPDKITHVSLVQALFIVSISPAPRPPCRRRSSTHEQRLAEALQRRPFHAAVRVRVRLVAGQLGAVGRGARLRKRRRYSSWRRSASSASICAARSTADGDTAAAARGIQCSEQILE